jgi:hypothetical protein
MYWDRHGFALQGCLCCNVIPVEPVQQQLSYPAIVSKIADKLQRMGEV